MIDFHSHFTDEKNFKNHEYLIDLVKKTGVSLVSCGGTDPNEWEKQIVLKKKYGQFFHLNFGLHPWWVQNLNKKEVDDILTQLKNKLHHSDVRGVGETGLDFFKKQNQDQLDLQEYAFLEQVKLASQFSKPLILHVVSAHEKVSQLLKQEKIKVPFALHRYSGRAEQQQLYDFYANESLVYFSFNSAILKPGKTQKAFLNTRIDRLFLESDSVGDVLELYQFASKLLKIDIGQLKTQILLNFKQFYQE